MRLAGFNSASCARVHSQAVCILSDRTALCMVRDTCYFVSLCFERFIVMKSTSCIRRDLYLLPLVVHFNSGSLASSAFYAIHFVVLGIFWESRVRVLAWISFFGNRLQQGAPVCGPFVIIKDCIPILLYIHPLVRRAVLWAVLRAVLTCFPSAKYGQCKNLQGV